MSACFELIRAIHAESDGSYGSPRVHAELRHRGVRVARKRVERLMRRHGLSGLVKRAQGEDHDPGAGRASGARSGRARLPAGRADRLWVADLTEVSSWEGKLYPTLVLDCFSRRVVGWSMAEHRRSELVIEALEMAVRRRKPAPGLVHHCDQGSPSTSRCASAALPRGRDPDLDGSADLGARQRRLRSVLHR